MKRPLSDSEGSPSAQPGYASTALVSRALGVSITTVKRWVDDGILPAHKSPGGHRKLLLEDVLRLASEGDLPHADLTLLRGGDGKTSDLTALRVQLDTAIEKDDSEAIRSLLHGAFRSGLPIGVLADTLIAPALRELGENWRHGVVSVMREHRMTQFFVSALHQVNSQLRTRTDGKRPVAVGCAPEADHYILPTLLAKMTLTQSGWKAIDVGPNTPFSALEAAMNEFEPRLIWLSVSHLADPERFTEEYSAFYQSAQKRGVAVAVGGQAMTQEFRSKLAYTTFGDGFVQLGAFAKLLGAPKRVPKRGRPAGSGKKLN